MFYFGFIKKFLVYLPFKNISNRGDLFLVAQAPLKIQEELDPRQEVDFEILPETHPPMYLMHKYWARKPANIVREYIEKYCPSRGIVLDPFMGSGVSIIEANLLGRKAIGVDINPVSCFIAHQTAQVIDLELFTQAFDYLRQRVEQETNGLYNRSYEVKCPHCQERAYISHVVWENTQYLQRDKPSQQGSSSSSQPPNLHLDRILEIRIQCVKCKEIMLDAEHNTPFFSEYSQIISNRERETSQWRDQEKGSPIEMQLSYSQSIPFIQLRHTLRTNPDIKGLFTPLNFLFLTDLTKKIHELPPSFGSYGTHLNFV